MQDFLKRWRTVDDKIIYQLNEVVPTASFRGNDGNGKVATNCKYFYEQLLASYRTRDTALDKCIGVTQAKVQQLNQQRADRPDDSNLQSTLRNEQSHLRMLQSERMVEDVVRKSTLKAFSERCRHAYTPPTQ